MMGTFSLPHRPITRVDRLNSPNSLLTKLLAVVGLIFLIERTASFYLSTSRASFSSVISHHNSLYSDHILSYEKENSGLIKNTGETKAIIVASTTSENTTWLHEHFSDWNLNIYVVNNLSAPLTVPHTAGNEASVFLTYLITHYFSLPTYMIFHHAARYQWHNDNPMYDAVPVIQSLRLSHVKRVGYASLRCAWEPGCPGEMRPTTSNEGADDDLLGVRNAYAAAFSSLFPSIPVPEVVAAPCCAQFAVTRAQVLRTPLEVFERTREWLYHADLIPATSGRVMEYLWHVLFSQPYIACPDTQTCYCLLFGLCNLTCPTAGFCEGRWWHPGYLEPFPKGWPEHGQGERGFPRYGWWWDVYPNETWGLEGTDMRHRLREGEEYVGAGNEGMSLEELKVAEEELRGLMGDEDRGAVFREEWEGGLFGGKQNHVDAEAAAEGTDDAQAEVDDDGVGGDQADLADETSGALLQDGQAQAGTEQDEHDLLLELELETAVRPDEGDDDKQQTTPEDDFRQAEEEEARKTAAQDEMFSR